ncbi:TraQ conjugal transfer family protein [Flavobacterium aestivum]|uniref:TraQ conjugal transfer family protein n=1 Tax=Flavobacterium aestivum TaxID=3003257 RepID=UPI0024824579|nr:TraQ conjugal transfer family protein [Flavobacterium aestivum]
MKSIFNYKNFGYTVHFKYLWLFFAVMLSASLFSSCEKEDLKIQKDFPFEVSVMPIPQAIANGDTVEIRLAIQRTDKYSGTQYFIRYFQYDGLGLLRFGQQHAFVPNNLYSIPAEQFRLYYTSQSFVTQSFTVWVSDTFGNERQVNFQLNSINR